MHNKTKNEIVRAGAFPKEASLPNENKILAKFKKLISRTFSWGKDLTQEYSEGKVLEQTGKGEISVRRAAEIAATTDRTESETQVLNQEIISKRLDNIDHAFGKRKDSPEAERFRLAALLDGDPELIDQVQKVQDKLDKLFINKNVRIVYEENSKMLPPAEEDEDDIENDEETGKEPVK